MRNFGNNLVLFIFITAAAAVLFFYACPWMEAIGHKYLCHGLFLILLVVVWYARAGGAPKKRSS